MGGGSVDEGTQGRIIDTITRDGSGNSLIPTPPNEDTFIETALESVFFFAGFVALVFIVYAGFQYVTSSGDPQKVQSAKNSLIYAIVGFIIALSAFTIVNLTLGAAES